MVLCSKLSGALIVAVAVPTAIAATPAFWSRASTGGPPPTASHAMAFDSARNATVMFGGLNPSISDATWTLQGSTWTRQLVPGPSGRSSHAMAFDSMRGVVVLFGGDCGPQAHDNSETWEWNGSAWTQRVVSGPPGRSGHAMAYDAARGVTVLFGGRNSFVGFDHGDTWEWNGISWTQRTVVGPPPRRGHAMCYDSQRGVVVMYGGNGQVPSGYFDDTWEWNGSAWSQRNGVTAGARSEHAMAFDASRGVSVLMGGSAPFGGGARADTWEWDGSQWRPQSGAGPGARISHAAVYDTTRSLVKVHGGHDPALVYKSDTWVLSASLRLLGDRHRSNAISGDGSTVVGTSVFSGSDRAAFRWTLSDGLMPIQSVFGVPAEATATAHDGSVIAGIGLVSGRGWYLTATNGYVEYLTPQQPPSFHTPTAVSADGSYISGYGNANSQSVMRWSQFGGLQVLGNEPPAWLNGLLGKGMSADGNVIVGIGQRHTGRDAFRWTIQTGFQTLPLHPSRTSAEAHAASGPGTKIVGDAFTSSGDNIAVMWNGVAVPIALGSLPCSTYQHVDAISWDGEVAVGNVGSNSGEGAFVWTASGGMQYVRDVLNAHGVDTGNLVFMSASGVSADGRTLTGDSLPGGAGSGTGWIACLEDWTKCRADLDNGSGQAVPDGGVDVNDLLYFLSTFEQGSCRADLDDGTLSATSDGGVDINDLLFFLAKFEAGC